MNQKKWSFKSYGLRARFARSLGVAVIICSLLFLLLYNASDLLLTDYFEKSDYMEASIKRQGASLQKYIRKNHISSSNLQGLKKWERKQPLILLELYFEDKCIYSSFYDIPENEFRYELNPGFREHVIHIQLEDKKVDAVLYSDFTYQYYVMSTAAAAVITLIVFILLFLYSNRKLIHYISRLNEEVQILEGGNLEFEVSVEGNDEVTDLAKSMNRMRISFQQQRETEQRLHQTNRRLVTEMSHDLRTPLTGIILYLEILRSHRYSTDEDLQNYLEKIDAKAHHMKEISDHLFEYSLVETFEGKPRMQTMRNAFSKVITSFTDDMTEQGFCVMSEIGWPACYVDVNDEYIQRIFENIASNVAKYADPSGEIIINLLETELFCGFSVMNLCAPSDDQIESNKIGIESILSMMKEMNGNCIVEQTESVFEISLLFPKKNH